MSTLDRLREMGCDREPFTPEHEKCICRLTNEAANDIEQLQAELELLQLVAGTLAVHVRGHFAMASATSPTICQEWAAKVQDTIAAQDGPAFLMRQEECESEGGHVYEVDGPLPRKCTFCGRTPELAK
jgi:hypothetical protein